MRNRLAYKNNESIVVIVLKIKKKFDGPLRALL